MRSYPFSPKTTPVEVDNLGMAGGRNPSPPVSPRFSKSWPSPTAKGRQDELKRVEAIGIHRTLWGGFVCWFFLANGVFCSF